MLYPSISAIALLLGLFATFGLAAPNRATPTTPLTNAARFSMGLPPKPPNRLYSPDRVRRSTVSPLPGPCSANIDCATGRQFHIIATPVDPQQDPNEYWVFDEGTIAGLVEVGSGNPLVFRVIGNGSPFYISTTIGPTLPRVDISLYGYLVTLSYADNEASKGLIWSIGSGNENTLHIHRPAVENELRTFFYTGLPWLYDARPGETLRSDTVVVTLSLRLVDH